MRGRTGSSAAVLQKVERYRFGDYLTSGDRQSLPAPLRQRSRREPPRPTASIARGAATAGNSILSKTRTAPCDLMHQATLVQLQDERLAWASRRRCAAAGGAPRPPDVRPGRDAGRGA